MIDLYCERAAPGLADEPLNLISNLAFFLAALALWRMLRERPAMAPDGWLLLGLMVAIGIGSMLFHMFAAAWARRLDELPILLFQITFLWLYGRRMLAWPRMGVATMIAGYLAVILLSQSMPPLLNGSLAYVPAFILLILLGAFHLFNADHEPYLLLLAAVVFHVALIFRTLDLAVCEQFPVGTHFLWHLTNGVVLYLASRAYLLNRAPASGSKP